MDAFSAFEELSKTSVFDISNKKEVIASLGSEIQDLFSGSYSLDIREKLHLSRSFTDATSSIAFPDATSNVEII